MGHKRRTNKGARVSAGAAVVVLAGSATLGLPGVAHADTKTVNCGDTVTAAVGDQVFGRILGTGLLLDLGFVKQTTTTLSKPINELLRTVCRVEVRVVRTAQQVAPQTGTALEDVQRTARDAVDQTSRTLGQALPGGNNQPAPQRPGGGTESGPRQQGSTQQSGGSGNRQGMPPPNSPVLGSFTLPGGGSWPMFGFNTGWAPMRDYSGIPVAAPGLYAPSPSIRYGGQVPGYSPEFGILGDNPGQPSPDNGVRSAGDAHGLPGSSGLGDFSGAGLPTLLAVLALSGVTAALVRTWVLRRVAA